MMCVLAVSVGRPEKEIAWNGLFRKNCAGIKAARVYFKSKLDAKHSLRRRGVNGYGMAAARVRPGDASSKNSKPDSQSDREAGFTNLPSE